MKIIIAGATGLIGEALVKRLIGRHELVLFSRNVPAARQRFNAPGIHFADWHQPPSHLAALIEGSKVLINLAGAGIGDARWTTQRKQALLWSRVQTVEALHTLIKASELQLDTIIQASAVGYYGNSDEEVFDETSQAGSGFLSEVSVKWEEAAHRMADITRRLVIIRSGVVLAAQGGALPKMALPFRFFAGGPLGSGKQWLSWIDIEDEVEAILFLLNNTHCEGPYNLVAPEAVRQKDFAKALGRVLNRPALMPAPAFAIRLALGEMGQELLLRGARVQPRRLLEAGFNFHFTRVEASLNDKLKPS